MGSGFPPYCGDTSMNTYTLILRGKLEFPSVLSQPCRDLVRRLLQPAATKRLGCLRNGGVDVRLHPWFGALNMQHLLRMRERSAGVDGVDVPFKPTLKDELDASNFETFEEVPDEPYHDDGTGWDEAF